MKNVFKVLGIIAIVAVIGFSFAACGDDDGGDGGGGPSFLGDKLELSGQVYLPSYTATGITYQKFDGNLTLDDYFGGSGEVKNGKLSYTIGVPNPSDLEILNFNEDFDVHGRDYSYDSTTISNPNAKRVIFNGFDIEDGSTYYNLRKANDTGNINSQGYSSTYEEVIYVYVDSDVTISGKGKTITITNNDTYNGVNDSSTYTTKDFSLALKTGWNAVYMKQMFTETNYKSTYTMAISLSNPSLKWTLYLYDLP